MATILEVFDPAMCCSTGVCGPEVDPKLIHFAADLDWLKSQHVDVRRYNLAHQPGEFARQAAVKDLLTNSGTKALPALVVNGVLASQGRYPDRLELAALAGMQVQRDPAPSTCVTAQTRELIALGAAVAANCESCFEFHRAELAKLAVSADDVSAAIDIAQRVKTAASDNIRRLAQPRPGRKDTSSACCDSNAAAVPVEIKTRSKSSCCGG